MRIYQTATVGIVVLVCSVGSAYAEPTGADMVNSWTLQRSLAGAAGAIAAGEALLLLIGMNVPQPTAWSTPSNIGLALSDVLVGGALVALVSIDRDAPSQPWFYVLSSLLVVTHTYREVEYFIGVDQPFAANTPLFVLNNLKLALAAGGITLSIALQP